MSWKTIPSTLCTYLSQSCGCFVSLVLSGVESNNCLFFPLKQPSGNPKTLKVLGEDVIVTQVLYQLKRWQIRLFSVQIP